MSKVKKYMYSFKKHDHCLPEGYQEMLQEIDKQLQEVEILMHMTTLERITDAVYDYLKQHGQIVGNKAKPTKVSARKKRTSKK